MTWLRRLSVRAKLLLASIGSVLLVASLGGYLMLSSARATMESQINGDLERSADLLTSLVRRTSEANVQSYLRGIAEKNVEMLAALHRQVERGELSEAEARARGRDLLLSQRIGKTGYIYTIDSAGIIRVHPKAALHDVNLSKHAFIQQQKRDKNGYLEYDWANPGETKKRAKALSMAHFAPFDWIVSASSYREEFDSLLDLKALAQSVGSVRFGETGYAFIIDEEGKLIVHPALQGENIADARDERGRAFIREMLAQKSGRIAYSWKNPGQASPREKIVVFRHIPERHWIVATSVYVDELYLPLESLKRTLWATMALMIAALVLTIFAVGTAITRPLGRLMERISQIWGELELGTHVSTVTGVVPVHDEIARLERRFDDMAIGIRNRDRQLAEHRENLERQVEQRTAELTARNVEMRLVLDTIDQGMATIGRDGMLGTERSAAFSRWFTPPTSEARAWTVLGRDDEELTATFELGWESALEGFLPLELTLEQMPRHLERNGRTYTLDYKPILDAAGELERVLLVATDVTAQVEMLKHEAEQKEFLAVFERLMRDKTGFVEFFNEASELTDELSERPPEDDIVLSRRVHTLKGNAGIFGVRSVAAVCHELEERAKEAGIAAMREALPLLVDRWTAFAQRVVPLIGTEPDHIVRVDFDDLEELAAAVRSGAHPAKLLAAIDRLKGEPTRTRFLRFAEQAKAVALRLEKGPIQVVIEDHGVRLPAERWRPFWRELVHVIRNAVDHGLESDSERMAAGKEAAPAIVLRSAESNGSYIISITDNGRGIDWAKVREKAQALGLPTQTPEQLEAALAQNGLSTKEVASDISGRGVGLGAVAEAARQLGGRMRIESDAGAGTTVTFVVPIEGNDRAPLGSLLPGVCPALRPPVSIPPIRLVRSTSSPPN